MIAPYVTIQRRGFNRLMNTVRMQFAGTRTGAIRDGFRLWGRVYRSFAQRRFSIFSGGGGNWASLADSTKRGRRGPRKGHKGKRKFGILYDTGLLFGALSPSSLEVPGRLQQDIPRGIRVGYGGPHRHSGGSATIADIAVFHQSGNSNLPKREIITSPDIVTIRRMNGIIVRALKNEIRKSQI